MTGQTRSFIHQTGGLWRSGALVSKVDSVRIERDPATAAESTFLTFHPTLLHQGMIIVGVPYSEPRQLGLYETKAGKPKAPRVQVTRILRNSGVGFADTAVSYAADRSVAVWTGAADPEQSNALCETCQTAQSIR